MKCPYEEGSTEYLLWTMTHSPGREEISRMLQDQFSARDEHAEIIRKMVWDRPQLPTSIQRRGRDLRHP